MMKATFITSIKYEEDGIWVSYHVGAMSPPSEKDGDSHICLLARTTPPFIYEVVANFG